MGKNMGWLAGLLALVFLFYLFKSYPKIMVRSLGGLVLVIMLISGFWAIKYYQDKKHISQVELTIRYDADCLKDFPLVVITKNGSKYDILNRSFSIYGHRKGYSSSAYFSIIKNDKIIKPGGKWLECWAVPIKQPYYEGVLPNPKETIWTVELTNVIFRK